MIKAKNDDDTISSRTSVKLPISLVAGVVVGFAAFLYAQQQIEHAANERKHKETREIIDAKASDRYTGHEARQHAESIKQLLMAIKDKNDASHADFQRQINRISMSNK